MDKFKHRCRFFGDTQ